MEANNEAFSSSSARLARWRGGHKHHRQRDWGSADVQRDKDRARSLAPSLGRGYNPRGMAISRLNMQPSPLLDSVRTPVPPENALMGFFVLF